MSQKYTEGLADSYKRVKQSKVIECGRKPKQTDPDLPAFKRYPHSLLTRSNQDGHSIFDELHAPIRHQPDAHCRYTTQRLNLWRHRYSWASLAERGAGMRSGISSALSHVAWSIPPVKGFPGGVRPISARCVEHVLSVRPDLPQTTSLPNDDGRKTRARAFLRASRREFRTCSRQC